MKKVLVIEDDLNLQMLMQHRFQNELHVEFSYVSTYQQGLTAIANQDFDLFIIDINLELFSGFDILRLLNKTRSILHRVIVISSSHDTKDMIEAYECGATNYLVKPLNLDVLSAILRNCLRSLDIKSEGLMEVGIFVLKAEKRECYIREGEKLIQIDLTPIEYNIFYRLCDSAGRIVSKEELSFLGKDRNEPMSFKALDMHIKCLRDKLGRERIKTKRGIGFYIESN